MKHPKPQPLQSGGTLPTINQHIQTGIAAGWDVARFERLCSKALLNCTPWELCVHCAVYDAVDVENGGRPTQRLMKKYIAAGQFPPSVSLHFARLETWCYERLCDKQHGFGQVRAPTVDPPFIDRAPTPIPEEPHRHD